MVFLSGSVLYNLVLAFIIFAVSFYLFFTSTFNYWKDRGIPYVKPIIFFGNLKDQFLSKKHICDLFQDIYDQLKGHRYGGFYEMRKPALMIRDPALVHQILIKDFTHFYDHGFSADPKNDPLSANLFNLEGEDWRYLRNKLTPTFTSGKLKGMFEQICKCGEELNTWIAEQSKKDKSVEARPLMNNFTLGVIASCAFGLQMEQGDEVTNKYREVVGAFSTLSKIQAFRMALLFFWPKVGRMFGIKSFPDKTEQVITKIIRDTIKFRQDKKITRKDFLQLILNLQKQEQNGTLHIPPDVDYDADDDVINQMKYTTEGHVEKPVQEQQKVVFTESCIIAQSLIFLIAGSESVTTPLCFTLYALSQNPEIQKKAHLEIDTVLEKHNYEWSYQALKEMTYIDQIIQETFRKYPTAIALFRICTETYKIPDSNHVIEKGTRILIPISSIHNDPDNYKSPEVFDPDRFIDNNFKPSGTYLPFGDGPRICIAMRFAILEMKVAFTRVMSRYSVKLSKEVKEPIKFDASSGLTMPKEGLWFNFEERKTILN